MESSRFVVLLIVLFGLLTSVTPHPGPISGENPGNPRYTAPNLLSYDDLVKLGSEENIDLSLKAKMDELLHQPFVSSEFAGNPRIPVDFKAGKVVRVAQWNIERGPKIGRHQTGPDVPERIFAKGQTIKHRPFSTGQR